MPRTGGPNTPAPYPFRARKIAAWTTLDLIASYTFNLPPAASAAVPGLAKDGGKSVKMTDSKEKTGVPVFTAEYNPCGWRAWLNNTTISLGIQNVLDEDPPFAAGSFENGYDESLATIKGRFWYVQVKKRFWNAGILRLDLVWAALRGAPAFQKLCEEKQGLTTNGH
jgi:outer membrane receptor protein involved in Fe transport